MCDDLNFLVTTIRHHLQLFKTKETFIMRYDVFFIKV